MVTITIGITALSLRDRDYTGKTMQETGLNRLRATCRLTVDRATIESRTGAGAAHDDLL
jgi:hypothetical protein